MKRRGRRAAGLSPAAGAAVRGEIRVRRGELDLDVCLDVKGGERCLLAGANGSGKSTLLQVLAGLVNPMEGRLEIGGVAVAGAGIRPVRPERRDIGYLPQDSAVFPHLTVAANVAYPLRARRWPRAEITARSGAVIDALGLGAISTLPGKHLSGGQAGRTALARALAAGSALLLLDEPFAALDPPGAAEVRVLLADWLNASGQTCLMVSHDSRDAVASADRVIVLAAGRLSSSDYLQAKL